MSNKSALRTYPIELHEQVVFRDEWAEKDLFGYAIYEVTYIYKRQNICTVKETKTGIEYPETKLTELRPLILN